MDKDTDNLMNDIMSKEQGKASDQVNGGSTLGNIGAFAEQAMNEKLDTKSKSSDDNQPKSSASDDPQQRLANSTNSSEEQSSSSTSSDTSSSASSADTEDNNTDNEQSELDDNKASMNSTAFSTESSKADSELSQAYGTDYYASDYSPFDALSSASTAIDKYKKAGRSDNNISPEQAHDMDMFCKNAIQAISTIHSGMNHDYIKLAEMAKALESQEKVICDSKHAGQLGALMVGIRNGVFEKITQFMNDMVEMYESPEFQAEIAKIKADKQTGKNVDLKRIDPAHLNRPEYHESGKRISSLASEYDKSKTRADKLLHSLSAKGLTGKNNIFTMNYDDSSASSSASSSSSDDSSTSSVNDDKNEEDK